VCTSGDGTFHVFANMEPVTLTRPMVTGAGVPYEATVYSKVLARCTFYSSILWGLQGEKRPRQTWLLIEYLKGASRDASKTNDAVIHAARWIGRFHALNEKRISSSRLGFLRKYDAKYYVGWARRANRLFGRRGLSGPGSLSSALGLKSSFHTSLSARKTVIHGEY